MCLQIAAKIIVKISFWLRIECVQTIVGLDADVRRAMLAYYPRVFLDLDVLRLDDSVFIMSKSLG